MKKTEYLCIITVQKGGVTCSGGDLDAKIFERVKTIVVEQLGIDDGEVVPEAAFVEDLGGADSLDVVELIMAFEEEFDLQITDEEASKISIVRDAVEYIMEQL